MNRIKQIEVVTLIAIGAFVGSNLRYFITTVVTSSLIATATANIIGCLGIGFILYQDIFAGLISEPAQTVLTTGLISSFTTYSTFVIDTITVAPMMAVIYIFISYAFGFVGVVIGREGARWFATQLQPKSDIKIDD